MSSGCRWTHPGNETGRQAPGTSGGRGMGGGSIGGGSAGGAGVVSEERAIARYTAPPVRRMATTAPAMHHPRHAFCASADACDPRAIAKLTYYRYTSSAVPSYTSRHYLIARTGNIPHESWYESWYESQIQ